MQGDRTIRLHDVLVILRREVRDEIAAQLQRAAAVPVDLRHDVIDALGTHFVTPPLGWRARRGAVPALAEWMKAAVAAPYDSFPGLGILVGTVPPEGLERLHTSKDVELVAECPDVELIRPTRGGRRLDAPPHACTWGLARMRIPALWEAGLTGAGVRIGHLDTGVDGAHEALAGAIDRFAAFGARGEHVKERVDPFDSDAHGTHTAGTLVGRGNRSHAIGVAPAATLASAVVIEGGDRLRRLMAGLQWVLLQDIRVLNLSLGFRDPAPEALPLLRRIFQIVRVDRGVLPVCAIGNEGRGTARAPGFFPEVLSVGAVDRSGDVAETSSSKRFGARVTPAVLAPGVDVISARASGGYVSKQGTSQAAPHVAGLAALLFQAVPDASADEVERAIQTSAGKPPKPSRALHGVPNGEEALRALRRRRGRR